MVRMARPLRLQFPGAICHVMSRGIERRPIVPDDADRQRWIDWLRRTVETYGWRLHAFVLMTNTTKYSWKLRNPTSPRACSSSTVATRATSTVAIAASGTSFRDDIEET